MTPKGWSLFFSVLLASSFVHDLRVKASDPPPSYLSHVVKRAVVPIEKCEWVCKPTTPPTPNPPTNSTGLNITVNVQANIFAVYNQTAKTVLVFDIAKNFVALFNGTSGAGLIININATVGTYISKGAFPPNTSIVQFIASLSNGLTPLLKASGAVSFQVNSASSEILTIVNRLLVTFLLELSVELQGNTVLGIRILIAIGFKFVTIFNGPLKGYIKLFPTNGSLVTRDLLSFLTFIQGLAIFFSNVPGGITAIIRLGINIRPDVLYKLNTGLDRLAYLISVIGAKIKIDASLAVILNDPVSLFKLIADLGVNGNIGIDGIFRVLAYLAVYVSGNGTLEVFVSVVIRFLAINQINKAANQNISVALNASLSNLRDVLGKVGANTSLSGLVKITNDLIKGTLIIKEVNFSAIITLLIAGITGTNPLQVLISILLLLKPIVDPSISIPTALLILIIYLNSPLGILLIAALGIVINISIGIGGLVGGILAIILGSVVNLIALILGGILNALLSLPVISNIVRALATALIAASNGSLDLRIFLNANNSVVILIKALIQIITGAPLGANQTSITRVRGIIRDASCFGLYAKVDVGIDVDLEINARL